MTRIHTACAAAVLSVAVLGGAAYCAGRSEVRARSLKPQAASSLTAAAGMYRVRLTARLVARSPAESASPPWGADKHQSTWRLVTSMEIWRGKERIEVPRSAFADLADPSHVDVKSAQHGCAVTMAGGDAGCAWKAEMRADGKRVTRRTVRSAEFPDYAWEETRYVEDFPPNM